jgi:FtsZ-binding cell division protein ZapB
MEHDDLIKLAMHVLENDFGYNTYNSIVDCSRENHKTVNPDLYTKDKEYCVEAGKINVQKFRTKENRFQLLLKEYKNVIWIPFPELSGSSLIPVIRVYVYSHNFLDFNLEELSQRKNALALEIPVLEKQRDELRHQINSLEDRLRVFNEIKDKLEYVLRGVFRG